MIKVSYYPQMTKVQNGSLNKFYSVLSNIGNGLSLTGPSEREIFSSGLIKEIYSPEIPRYKICQCL